MTGTAAPPISSNGRSTSAGTSMPSTAMRNPRADAMIRGLRTGCNRMRPSEKLPAGAQVEDRERDRRHHDQLQQDDGRRGRGIAEHVGRQRQSHVGRVGVHRGERPDRRLGHRATPDQDRDSQEERDIERRDRRGRRKQIREQRVDIRFGQHGEEQRRRENEERQPAQHITGVGAEQIRAADPVPEGDHEGDDREPDEYPEHPFSVGPGQRTAGFAKLQQGLNARRWPSWWLPRNDRAPLATLSGTAVPRLDT